MRHQASRPDKRTNVYPKSTLADIVTQVSPYTTPHIPNTDLMKYWWNNKETPDGGPAKVCLITKNSVAYWALTCSYCNKQPECTGACMENVVPGFWNNTGDAL
ncbi:hypothetical protein EG327_009185 [Venturia inaequalis]|uniref:Uncharacterized protein n=1 Tax=Venturia inaequalis TaxID=5025 RepID=A0A8H3VVU6_VENIN|nr:hypothetical protein EG327_009185 [Venturia inaequalis]